MERSLLYAIVVVLIVIAIGAAVYYYFATVPAPGSEVIKVALVLPGSKSDHGWSQSAFEGLMAAKKKYDIEVDYTEYVLPPEAGDVIRDYCEKGYKLIIVHDFLAKDAVLAAAADYPDIYFCYPTGMDLRTNVASYWSWNHETSYLAGMLAAGLTNSSKVGVYAAVQIPTIVCCLESFKLGVKDMAEELGKNVTIYEAYTGTFEDVAKGYEAVETFASYGADVVYGTGDGINVGGIEAARTHGIYFIGGCGDQHPLDPEKVIASCDWGGEEMICDIIGKFLNGTLQGNVKYEYTLGGGIGPHFAKYYEDIAPEELVQRIDETEQAILNGTKTIPKYTEPGSVDP